MDAKPGVDARHALWARWAVAISGIVTFLSIAPLGGLAAEPAKPTQAAPASPPPADHAKEEGKLQHLAPTEAASVLGRPVHGEDGHDIGRIVDVLVDQAGHPRAAVIDFGGFMGVGSRKVAVDWHLLHFTPGDPDKPITLELTPDQIKATPEYKPGSNPTVVTAPPTPGRTGLVQGAAPPPQAAPAPPPANKPAAASGHEPAPGPAGAGASAPPASSR